MAIKRPTILAPIPFFEPGYKAGGSVRTLSNLIRAMQGHYRFRIVCTDRDLGDSAPYAGVPGDRLISGEVYEAYYLTASPGALRRLIMLVKTQDYELLYLNSVFSPLFTLLPLALRRLRIIRRVPVVICPRGELSDAALTIKSYKKRPFLKLAAWFGLYRDAVWQSASPYESEEIRRRIGPQAEVMLAPDFPSLAVPDRIAEEKRAGQLRLIFFSRIAPIKNLLFALNCVQQLEGKATLDIYGPIEDASYWRLCQEAIDKLANPALVAYRGALAPHEVANTLTRYDLFVLPTLGEGYGHAIVEALTAGCPVLISDRTPWRGLADKGVGWELSLSDEQRFVDVLSRCAAMDGKAHRAMKERAAAYGREIIHNDGTLQAHVAMFERACGIAAGREEQHG